MKLTREEKEMITIGLQMRKNLIQTGNCTVQAETAAKMSPEAREREDCEIKALSDNQMQLCIDTNKLIQKILNS